MGEQFSILGGLASLDVELLEPGRVAAEFHGFFESNHVGFILVAGKLHIRAEMQVIENPQSLDGVGCRHTRVLDHHEIVPVAFFSAH